MECLQNRIDSFTKPKRVKNPAKSSSFVSVKWSHPPHPQFIATPETLAEAGFYYNPSFEDRDNVACFVCHKQLADWEAEDDPFDIHWAKCGDRCCWAIVRCGLRSDINRQGGFTFTDQSRVPTSKAMERARFETFSVGDGWIHDQIKNHGASSRKMARAGFVFTPQHVGDDLATCLYCNVALSGWEASDDPLEEHQKRQKVPCPMFDAGEPATKTPFRTPSAKAPSSRSQPLRHARSVSASKNTDFVQPMKIYDGDADESDAAPPPSSKRIRTLSGSNKSAKTPKILRSQSLKDVAEDDEDVETEEDVPRTGRAGRAKPKKSIGTTTKKTKSRSKSIARRATSDDEEEVMSKVPSRSRSKAKGKEKATVDNDEPEEIRAPKKSARGRPPTRVKEQEDNVQEVKALKKSTRSRAPARVEESEDDEEEEQEVETLKKSTRSRAPARVKEPDYDDEGLTKTVKKPTRTKKTSPIEGIATTARKPSKTRKVKELEPEPEPEPEPELEPESELELHDADMEATDEEERKPRAHPQSHAKTPAAGRPSRARSKAAPSPMQEEVAPALSPIVVQRKRTPSTSARIPATNVASGTVQSLVKPTVGTSGRSIPAAHRDEDNGDADELVTSPPSETKKRIPTSSTSTKLKASRSKAKRKGAPAPAPTPPKAEATDDDDDDEMDVFVSPRESPEPSAKEVLSPDQKDPEVDDGMKPLIIPKREAKPLSLKPNDKPTKPVDDDVNMEPMTEPRKPMTGVKPQIPRKEIQPARESETKSRKGSFLKVVEISTDEEGGVSDEEQLPPPPKKSESAQKTASPSIEAPSSSISKKAVEKPLKKPLVIVEPPQQPSAEPGPSSKRTPPPPSPPSAPTKPLTDVEMVEPETEPLIIETQPAEPVVEVPVPLTPPRVAAPPKAPMPEPPLFVPPLSKLPFTPLQDLTDAELDMTVEEWIRYQMEMEYDKFKRDGEREIGRFKKSAEEAKNIIERL